MRTHKILILEQLKYCGGTVALAELCRILQTQGCDVRLLLTEYYPTDKDSSTTFLRTLWYNNLKFYAKLCICRILPFKSVLLRFAYDKYQSLHLRGCKVIWIPIYNKKNTIVVYPEYLYGNPLRAKYVVRWLLYSYKYWGDAWAYSDSDLFIGYRNQFVKEAPFKDIPIVTISSFDLSLYRQTNLGQREGECYIVRKGRYRQDLPRVFDGPIVDDLPEEEKVEVFNRCKYCYSYDTQTAYSAIASLCGCISVVVMEPGKTVSDYRSRGDQIYGVAFGDDPREIERAISTRPLLEERMKNKQVVNLQNADKFINIVENNFNCSLK